MCKFEFPGEHWKFSGRFNGCRTISGRGSIIENLYKTKTCCTSNVIPQYSMTAATRTSNIAKDNPRCNTTAGNSVGQTYFMSIGFMVLTRLCLYAHTVRQPSIKSGSSTPNKLLDVGRPVSHVQSWPQVPGSLLNT